MKQTIIFNSAFQKWQKHCRARAKPFSKNPCSAVLVLSRTRGCVAAIVPIGTTGSKIGNAGSNQENQLPNLIKSGCFNDISSQKCIRSASHKKSHENFVVAKFGVFFGTGVPNFGTGQIIKPCVVCPKASQPEKKIEFSRRYSFFAKK